MNSLSEIWVTGIGIISPLGYGFEQNIHSLKSGISPLKNLKGFDSVHNGKLMVGQVPLTNAELKNRLNIPGHLSYNRTTLFAFAAAHEAISGVNSPELLSEINLVSASTVGGMGNTESRFSEILKKTYLPDEN